MKTGIIGKSAALFIAAGIWVAATTDASATLILNTSGPGAGNPIVLTGASNPTDLEIANALGVPVDLLNRFLWKQERDNGMYDGPLKDSYTVVYDPSNGEGTATITHVPAEPAVDTSYFVWLLAKDGQFGHYLWNLTGFWDGTTTIEIEDLWDPRGAFSHIEIGTVAVPEPGTMIAGGSLLLLALAATKKRLFAK